MAADDGLITEEQIREAFRGNERVSVDPRHVPLGTPWDCDGFPAWKPTRMHAIKRAMGGAASNPVLVVSCFSFGSGHSHPHTTQVPQLVKFFRVQLKHPVHKRHNREQFQSIIDKIAVVDDVNSTASEKFLLLKDDVVEEINVPLARIVQVPKPAEPTVQSAKRPRNSILSPETDEEASASSGTSEVREALNQPTAAVSEATDLVFRPGRSDPLPSSRPTSGEAQLIFAKPTTPPDEPSSSSTRSSLGRNVLNQPKDSAKVYEDFFVQPARSQLKENVSEESAGGFQAFRQQWLLEAASSTKSTPLTGGSLMSRQRPPERRWLRAAALGGSDALQVSKELLQADPSIVDVAEPASGYTALHWAAHRGDVSLLQLIRPHIEDPNPRTSGGYTPLHLAALHGHAEIQAVLKAIGASEKACTYAGFNTTALRQSHMDNRASSDVGAKWTALELMTYDPGHKEDTLTQAVVGIKKMMSSLGSALTLRRPSKDGRESRESKDSRDSQVSIASNSTDGHGEVAGIGPIGVAIACGDFKVPDLPKKRKEGSRASSGGAYKSLRSKVFGKKKKRDESDLRRTSSQQDLSTPEKEAARFDLERLSKPHSASLEDLRLEGVAPPPH